MSNDVIGVLLFNLGFTIVLYSLFPVLFAAFRKNPIKRKTYDLICYAVNIAIAILIKAGSTNNMGTVSYSFAPCLLWTTLGTVIGKRILDKKNAQYEDNDLLRRYICKNCGSFSPEPLSECPKCGIKQEYIDRYSETAVPVARRFKCKKCGTEFSERRNHCPKCGADRIIERPTIPYIRDSKSETTETVSISSMGSQMADSTQITIPQKEALESNSADETVERKTNSGLAACFCRECGKRLDADVLFCPECGTKVIQRPMSGREESKAENGRNLDVPSTSIKERINELPPMFRRAFILTEDGEWDKADNYFERVLDDDPENAFAYLGKLLCENRINEIEKISTISNLANNKLFIRALQYSDETLKKTLRTLSER